MKFGHAFKDYLENGGFPPSWLGSAISYQKLKKCIKRVKLELASLGLDPETLQLLLDGAAKDDQNATTAEEEKVLRYER